MRHLALVIGIAGVLVGGYSLVGGGFSWSRREQVLDLGPIQATAETQRVYVLPRVGAGAAVAVGLILVLYGARRPS